MTPAVKKLIRIPLYLAILFAVGLAAGHLTFKALTFSKSVVVPDVRGKSMIEANAILKDEGLYIRLEGEDYDSAVPEGFVVRQDIPAGNKVKEAREIKVIVSKGPKIKYVPDLTGLTLDEAETQSRERGIRIGRVLYLHDGDTPKNTVIAQRPEAQEKGGESITVMVSLGDFPEVER